MFPPQNVASSSSSWCVWSSACAERGSWLFLLLFFSHRFFTPPAKMSRNHWRIRSQHRAQYQVTPALPSLRSLLMDPPTVLIPASPAPWLTERGMDDWRGGVRRRRGEEPTTDPCRCPPSSASSCLRPPDQAAARPPPLLQRRGRPASFPTTRRAAARPGSNLKPQAPTARASQSQRPTEPAVGPLNPLPHTQRCDPTTPPCSRSVQFSR